VPRTAVRTCLVLLTLIVAGSSGAIEARGETAPPTFELLEPAAGAKVDTSLERNHWLTYRARVTYPADYVGSRALGLEKSLDPSFPQGSLSSTTVCVGGVAVCEVSFRSNSTRLPLGTRVYWRISVPGEAVSQTQSFMTAGKPAPKPNLSDRDHDGIIDTKDNCPSLRNPKQTDFEYDGKGDACQPDRKTPRVKAYSGHERRGQYAQFDWKAVDNRPVTIRLVLRWQGRVVLRGWMPNVHARLWAGPASQWTSKERIDSSFPVGTYTYCISAQDAAGHKATSCAPYKITA